MAKETVGFVKLQWKCPNCGSNNPGPNKFCGSCGSPQPDNIAFEQNANQLITEQVEVDKAKAGADIYCPFCNTRNLAGAKTCSQCGGDLKDAKARASGKVIGAYKTGVIDQVNCPQCASPNPATAQYCGNCGGPLATNTILKKEIASESPNKRSTKSYIILGAVALAVCGILFWVMLNLFKTDALVGSVQNVSWLRSIVVEQYGPVQKEDWIDEIPSNSKRGICEKKYFGTQDQQIDGGEKICGTPYKVDKGNGYAEVVQDCQYKVYKDYCNYTVEEWSKFKDVTQNGIDINPQWPSPQLDKNQRIGTKTENYSVYFKTDKGILEYTTTDYNHFIESQPGSKWTLKINGFGAVVSADPVK